MSEPIAPVESSGREAVVRRRTAGVMAMLMAVGGVWLVHAWEKYPPGQHFSVAVAEKLIIAANKTSCVALNCMGRSWDTEGQLLFPTDAQGSRLEAEGLFVREEGSPMMHAPLLLVLLLGGCVVAIRSWELGPKRRVTILLLTLVLTIPLLVLFTGLFQAIGLLAALKRGDHMLSMAGVAAYASLQATTILLVISWLLVKDLVRPVEHVQLAPLPSNAVLSRPPILWAAMIASAVLMAALLRRVYRLQAADAWMGGSFGFRMIVGAVAAAAAWALLNAVLLRGRWAIRWVLVPLVGLAFVSDLSLTCSLVFLLSALAVNDERTEVVCGREVDGDSYERLFRRAMRPLTPLACILVTLAALSAAGAVLARLSGIELPYLDTLWTPLPRAEGLRSFGAIAALLAIIGAVAAVWEGRELRRAKLPGSASLAVAAAVGLASLIALAAVNFLPPV